MNPVRSWMHTAGVVDANTAAQRYVCQIIPIFFSHAFLRPTLNPHLCHVSITVSPCTSPPLITSYYYCLSDKSRILSRSLSTSLDAFFPSLILYLFRVYPSLPLLPCSLCPYCLTDPGLSSLFPPQRSGSGAGALRETAAVQSEEVQFFPLRLGSVRQTGSARRDRKDSFCGLCGEGESKRRFLEMPRKMIFFPPLSSSQNLGKCTCSERVLI